MHFSFLSMKEVKRPWGNFKQFAINKKCTVKILEVDPKQELSLQYHKKRKELWYFLTEGIAQVGKKKIKAKKGIIVDIQRKTPHRIIAGKNKVQVLEISFGEFKEKDEIRLEDKYGRK